MKYFSIPNLTHQGYVTEVEEPWKLPAYPLPEGLDKDARNKLWKSSETRHHFLSCVEGMTASTRVSKSVENPPYLIHGLIVDYDSDIELTKFDALVKKPQGDYPPAWGVITWSGHARLVWAFEAPIRVVNKALLDKLLPALVKRLNLSGWLAGLDTGALIDPARYFELGKTWIPMTPDALVPKANLDLWTFEAAKNVSLFRPGERLYDVPLELVAEKVAEDYKGRWNGPFVLGSRGPLFWDNNSKNPTSSIVCKDGMLCFAGDKPFVTWSEIFGKKWVEAFEADRVSKLMRRALWDEKYFWTNDEGTENWERLQAGQFTKWLKCAGFSTKAEKDDTASAADRAEMEVVSKNRVRGGLPFIYRPHGITTYKGERVLNTSTIRVIQPMEAGAFTTVEDAKTKWFPTIWSYLVNFLALVDGDAVQLEYLLGWMKHFYESGYYQKPQPGHALVLVGDTGLGKTFFAQVLLGKLMGGSNDSSDYLIKGSAWSDQLAKWPIAVVDDQQASGDFIKHQAFSASVKKLVANQAISYNGKWMSTGEVEWCGRVIITCNADPESIKLIPNLDHSIADKISILRVNDTSPFRFDPDREKTGKILDAELPAFARFLLEIPFPKHFINTRDTRYFLMPYKHPDCYQTAARSGQAYATHELLSEFLDIWAGGHKEAQYWEGTATLLFKDMASQGSGTLAMGRLTPRSLGTCLGMLANRGVNIEALGMDGTRGVQRWRIPVVLEWKDPDNPTAQLNSPEGRAMAKVFRKTVLNKKGE